MFHVFDAHVGRVDVKNVLIPLQIPEKNAGMSCVKNGTMCPFHTLDAQVGSVEVKNVLMPPHRLPKNAGISWVKNVSTFPTA